ncbi:cytochrome c biogenesis CcdA family protein [candidate division KSB1 bacterium]
MEIISISFIISAFVAGLITFLAPCTLPLVPAYLAFISGVSSKDIKDDTKKRAIKRGILLNGFFFVLGFSVIFILFGAVAGTIGQILSEYRLWLSRVGGLFVIIFGLSMLGVFDIPFLGIDKHIRLPKFLSIGKPSSSFFIGSIFAFGWTPCIGPILGSILLLASTSNTASQGALLLTVFSIGLAVPFLLVALGFSHATAYINKFSKYFRWFSYVGGVFLVILGTLLITDSFGLLVQYGFGVFDFIEYDILLNYL